MRIKATLISLAVLALAAGGCARAEWARVSVERDAEGHLKVVLENETLLARYAFGWGGSKDRQEQGWAIRDLVIKAANEDQVDAFVDACATRGFLQKATVTVDAPEIKTVRLEFDDGKMQDLSIFPGKPYLRITYLTYGVNLVDIGAPGGGRRTEGVYEIHGAERWHRPYELYPNSYYDRYPGDKGKENVQTLDVADGGPLSYRGYFILGVYNAAKGRGFGRVAAVEDVDVVKLLFKRGFELFPHPGRRHEPFTAYVFVVRDGAEDVLATGRRIVDEEILRKGQAAGVADDGTGVGGPRPGDVFREYTYAKRFHECDPGATCMGSEDTKRGSGEVRRLSVDDLEGAVRAEVSVQYWGGHIGTGDQRFRVNGSAWFQIPQPRGTPTEPQCYYRTLLGENAVEIPLELLKQGENAFEFACGKQIRYGFKWGFFWVYSFTVRVYYGPSKPHPSGRITFPGDGETLGDAPVMRAEARSPNGAIRQVDCIALYEDFDWEGNGLYRQWHYLIEGGNLSRHVGTATQGPYEVRWDTSWVPDQRQPVRIMARLVDATGLMAMTPSVEGLRLGRSKSIRMYKPEYVPENFGVRVGARKACMVFVDDDPAQAEEARLVLSTWSAAHADEIGLNGTKLVDRIGRVHNVSHDAIRVPLELLRKGRNEFYVFSNTEHHAAEINWPGPVLMLRFTGPNGPNGQAGQTRPAGQ